MAGTRTTVDSLGALSWSLFLFLSAAMVLLPLTAYVPVFSPTKQSSASRSSNQVHKDDSTPQGSDCNSSISCKSWTTTEGQMKSVKGTSQNDSQDQLQEVDIDIMPKFKADCWCPAHLKPPSVSYTNRVCASAFDQAIRGLGTRTPSASVFITDKRVNLRFDKDIYSINKTFDKMIKAFSDSAVYTRRTTVFNRYSLTMNKTSPLFLFIITLLLLVPSVLWVLLRNIISDLNIDKTVDMLHRTFNFNADHRRKAIEDVVCETTVMAASSGSLSKLFLFCRVAICLVSIAELCLVAVWFLPQLNTLSVEMKELLEISKLTPLKDSQWSRCVVYALDNVQKDDQTVNCLYSPAPQGKSNIFEVYSKLDGAAMALSFYEGIFTLLCAFLILHLTVNILGTASWITRLCSGNNCPSYSCRPFLERSNFPGDILLFLFILHDRLGHTVSLELAKSFKQSQNVTNLACQKNEDLEGENL